MRKRTAITLTTILAAALSALLTLAVVKARRNCWLDGGVAVLKRRLASSQISP